MIVRNVHAYYASRSGPPVRAVDNVSLTIHEGEVLGIAGESGCGKSTLAAVISLTARPPLIIERGEMELNGQTIRLGEQINIPDDWHGKQVALLPQRAMNSLNPTARIRDFVVDVVRAHDPVITSMEAVELARQRLELLSLPPRVLDSYPHQLSGGMRQRVVAVVSTLLNPTVLIADEPTSALDVSSQKELVLLLRLLLEHQFITRIGFITHDLPLLSNVADRIAIMYAGEVVEVGTTKEIVDTPQHPYTKALIGSTLDPDPRVRGQRLTTIRGAPPDLRYPPSGCRFHPRCPYL
ncbi:MAG TPA: ABC transporter ATP-binding protein, partial [Caldilineaceae bacterium]|nr:ABC transporter ATP-binding protein [Caldilineaceae bacterium]